MLILTAHIGDAQIVNAHIANVSADKITAGTMSANRIYGGTISGVTINVNTDATIGQNLYLAHSGSAYATLRTYTVTTGDGPKKTLYIGKADTVGGTLTNIDRVDMQTDLLTVYGTMSAIRVMSDGNDVLELQTGTLSNRPLCRPAGYFWDTVNHIPIFWSGSAWYDTTGSQIS